MLTTLLSNVEAYIHSSPWLAVAAVFAGGALTASNPCVLVMIPLMMGVIAGQRSEKPSPLRALLHSGVFVAGLALMFTLMGVFAALAGTLYGEVSPVWNWVVAAVAVLMGLHLAGVVEVPMPRALRLETKATGALGAFLMGLAFGVVSAPCAAPILIVLLTYLASANASVAYGALLLFVYALGHGSLVMIAGTSMGAAKALIESGRVRATTEVLRRAAGAVVVLVGVYFAYRGVKGS
jgi:cytochrome c biogenesis protein CcdA